MQEARLIGIFAIPRDGKPVVTSSRGLILF